LNENGLTSVVSFASDRLVYRDIRPENIGFDVRGDVKVFDFGLAKGLSPSLKAKDKNGRPAYGYNLTPRTGSIPYMSPEIVEMEPYDNRCDVYSYGILLWELLSLKRAFPGYTRKEFVLRVVRNNERPSIKRSWPPLTRVAIAESWDRLPQKRPDMKRVSILVRGDLNELTTDAAVRDRTTHMRDRSAHSLRMRSRASQQQPTR
jgi:serine/threonine protein kinase